MKFSHKITGLDEVENMLKELPAAAAGNVGRRALRRGCREILVEARRHVPVGDRVSLGGANQPGQLLRAIKITEPSENAKGERVMSVVVTNEDAGINPYWVEFGTAPIRKAKGDGYLYFTINGKLIRKKQVAGVKAKPFMRPAADIAGPKAIKAITESLPVELVKEAEKLAKKGAKAKR